MRDVLFGILIALPICAWFIGMLLVMASYGFVPPLS